MGSGTGWKDFVPSWARHLVGKIRERIATELIKREWYPMREPLTSVSFHSNLGYDDQDDINATLPIINGYTAGSYQRIAVLWQQVRYLDRYKIPGALVECGVWRGGAAATMAIAHLRSSPHPTRRIHLFDSFQGLPEPSAIDGAAASALAGGRTSGAMRTIDQYVAAPEVSRKLIVEQAGYPAELLEYHVGWFEQTGPAAAKTIGPIALLRLDGDWYESTKICLDNLYSLVAPNGVVVIDDYGHFLGCHRAVDEFIEKLPYPIMLHHIDYTGRYWIKPAA